MNDSKPKTSSLCKTEEVMKKVLPENFKIDAKAVALVDKCLREFVTTVAAVGTGFSSIDVTPIPPSTSRELKPDHILHSLDRMGYTDYIKALSKYHNGLKMSSSTNKHLSQSSKPSAPPNRSVSHSTTSSKTVTTSTAHATQRKPTQKPPPTVANANQKPIINTKKPHPTIPSTSTIPTKQVISILAPVPVPTVNSKNVRLDRDLLFHKPALTEEEYAQKHKVACEVVRERVAYLKSCKYATNGVKFVSPLSTTARSSTIHGQPAPITTSYSVPMTATGPHYVPSTSRYPVLREAAATAAASVASTAALSAAPVMHMYTAGYFPPGYTLPSQMSAAAAPVPPQMSAAAVPVPPQMSAAAVPVPPQMSAAAVPVPPQMSAAAVPVPPQMSAAAVPVPLQMTAAPVPVPPQMTAAAVPVPPQMSAAAVPVPPQMSAASVPVPPQMSAAAAPVPPKMSAAAAQVPPQMSAAAVPVPPPRCEAVVSVPPPSATAISTAVGLKRSAETAGLEISKSDSITGLSSTHNTNIGEVNTSISP